MKGKRIGKWGLTRGRRQGGNDAPSHCMKKHQEAISEHQKRRGRILEMGAWKRKRLAPPDGACRRAICRCSKVLLETPLPGSPERDYKVKSQPSMD